MYLSWGQISSHYDVTYEKYTKRCFPIATELLKIHNYTSTFITVAVSY